MQGDRLSKEPSLLSKIISFEQEIVLTSIPMMDAFKKSEQYAVSLRKTKKREILTKRRQKLLNSIGLDDEANAQPGLNLEVSEVNHC